MASASVSGLFFLGMAFPPWRARPPWPSPRTGEAGRAKASVFKRRPVVFRNALEAAADKVVGGQVGIEWPEPVRSGGAADRFLCFQHFRKFSPISHRKVFQLIRKSGKPTRADLPGYRAGQNGRQLFTKDRPQMLASRVMVKL